MDQYEILKARRAEEKDESPLGRIGSLYSSLAQSVEHAAVNRSVVGSSPTGGVHVMRRGPRSGKIPDDLIYGAIAKW